MRLSIKNSEFLRYSLFILLIFSFGCEKSADTVLDSTGEAPFLSNAHFSISVIWTDTIFIAPVQTPEDLLEIRGTATVKVVHPEGKNGISRVSCNISKNFLSPSNGSGILNDDGIYPDLAANDSIYSGYLNFQIYRSDLGIYWISVSCTGTSGLLSNTELISVQIARTNRPPVISNLSAADTLRHRDVLRITLKVTDPDGQSDITSAGYFTLKPDSTYANGGNLIHMFDDGNPGFPSGDTLANDGIYTYSTYVPDSATNGIYKYSFIATDQSGASSDTITHYMVIEP